MPTSLDIQKRFDDLKADLSASALADGVSKTAYIGRRLPSNALVTMQINSDAAGVLDPTEVAEYQIIVDEMKTAQDAYNSAKTTFDLQNVTENFSSLGDAKGEYVLGSGN